MIDAHGARGRAAGPYLRDGAALAAQRESPGKPPPHFAL